MLRTATANLPPEQQQRLHADFLANEQDYLRMRPALLSGYAGQWVAVDAGQVIAVGDDVQAVTQKAATKGGHAYIAFVGNEDGVVFRVRRVEFSYDACYRPVALPQIQVVFANFTQSHSQTFDRVVPDTGADLCVLPDGDCAAFDLFSSPYFTAISGGVVGASMTTLIYQGKAEVAGHLLPALIQPVHAGVDRLAGRDVLNRLRILFDGPASRVIIDP